MNNHIIILAIIMLIAGAFGGLINYLLELRDNKEKASMLRSLVVGIGASYLVPLFLTMISSSLTSVNENEPEKYFVFAGFCLIASISSSAFIRTLSDRILNEAKKATKIAEEVKSDVQPIIVKETESDPEEDFMVMEKKIENLSSDAVAILKAFYNGEYTWRSISGLYKSTDGKIDKDTIKDELEELEEQAFVVSKESKHGGLRWALVEHLQIKDNDSS